MSPTFRRILPSLLCLFAAAPSAVAAGDHCAVDFKALLAWRMKLVLTATESKFLTQADCIREVSRGEFLKPDLSPKCAHVPYPGSSVEAEEAFSEAFDARDLFRQYAKKSGKNAWLGNLFQALTDRAGSFAKERCQGRDFPSPGTSK